MEGTSLSSLELEGWSVVNACVGENTLEGLELLPSLLLYGYISILSFSPLNFDDPLMNAPFYRCISNKTLLPTSR